jgi:hypothetical protein
MKHFYLLVLILISIFLSGCPFAQSLHNEKYGSGNVSTNTNDNNLPVITSITANPINIDKRKF